MMRAIRRLLAVGVIGLAVGAGGPTEAGMLIETVTGSFGPTTTLGGVALGADTPFSFQAEFDTSTGSSYDNLAGVVYSPIINLTIEIAGVGSFTGILSPGVDVFLLDPSYTLNGSYGAGLFNPIADNGFYDEFSTATTPFSASAPVPSTLLDFTTDKIIPFSISLVGVTGGLVINDLGSAVPTASLTSVSLASVPEPSSLALAGTAATIAALGGLLHRGRRGRIA
jgi:hypothetical protein